MRSRGLLALGLALMSVAPAALAQPQGPELSFEQALERILDHSTAIAEQQARLDATRARGLPAYLAFTPSLTLSAGTQVFGGYQALTDSRFRRFEGASDLNLWHWGADLAGAHAAASDTISQSELLNQAVLQTEEDGAAAIFNEIEARKELAALGDLVQARTESLSIAKERYRSGLLASQEVDMVSVDLDNARSRLADAQMHEVGTRAALRKLLGPDEIRAEWPWISFFTSRGQDAAGPEPRDEDEMATMLSARPDWRAAEAQVTAEDERTQMDWRLMLPSVDASASYGWYAPDAFPTSSGWIAGVSLTLPIFDHLQGYSTARAQGYVRESSEAALDQTRRDARSDWESSLHGFRIAVDSALAREKTLSVSRRLYQDNLKRFRAGRLTANDLSLDQVRVSDSEVFAAQGWSSAHTTYVRLCHARGKRLKDCLADSGAKH